MTPIKESINAALDHVLALRKTLRRWLLTQVFPSTEKATFFRLAPILPRLHRRVPMDSSKR